MEKNFARSKIGDYIDEIYYGDKVVLHIAPGTIINEQYAQWIVDVLNGNCSEPPENRSAVMKNYQFLIMLNDNGKTPEEAWGEAVESFIQDPGSTPDEHKEKKIREEP